MKFYIILPEYSIYKKYEGYFLQVIHFAVREKQIPVVFIGDHLPCFAKTVHGSGLTVAGLSELNRLVTSQDIIFDFFGVARTACLKHFQLFASTLDCSLYSCLLLSEPISDMRATVSFPVELLSGLWFETLYQPLPEFDSAGIEAGPVEVDQSMSSELRAKTAWLAQRVVADSDTSALEAILLGVPVDYPDKPMIDNLRDYFLTVKLLPSSVLTDETVFYEFVSSLQASSLVSDTVLNLHHLSLMKHQGIDKKSVFTRKLRKLKRDPVMFFYDALRKYFSSE